MMSDRSRRLWKIGATTAFGWFVFFLVFVLTLPYGRLKDYLVVLGEQQGYDIEVKSAGPAFGLGVRLKDMTISSRPSGGGKPMRIVVPVAKVRWSPLAALARRQTYQVSASVFGGDLDVETTSSKTESGLHVSATAIDLSEIPWVKAAINLPLSGVLDLRLDEKMPGLHASATVGSLTWTCSACALGDGKAKLMIPGNPLLAEGLGLPKIRLGTFVGRVAIDKGVGRLQGVQAKSPDGELYLEGEIKLSDRLETSWLDLYVRFKLSDALLKSSQKLSTIMQFAASAGKRPDGFYGFRISGSLTHLGAPVWTKTSPFGAPASGPKPIAARAGVPPHSPYPNLPPSAQAVVTEPTPQQTPPPPTNESAPAPAPPAEPTPPPTANPSGGDPLTNNPVPPPPPPPAAPAPTPPPPPPPPPAAEPAPARAPAPPAASDAAPAQPPS
jgi:type II secretion system protein N